jgi:hypothetical protein
MKPSSATVKLIPIYFASVLLAACGGGGGGGEGEGPDGDKVEETLNSGIFIDSPVSNLGYRTDTQSGYTNEDGEFLYRENEKITFYIGSIEFPEVIAKDIITPFDIATSDDLSNISVINIARLLQSLDKDRNPDNGIQIDDIAHNTAEQITLSFADNEFERNPDLVNLVANSGSTESILIDSQTAQEHLEKSLTELDIFPPQEEPNAAPTANAGGDQTVSEQSTVTLSGSGTDSDGTIASYSWTQTSGASVTLNNATSQAPSFVAPETLDPITLQFELTVTDNEGATAKDQVVVAVQPLNAAPTANAGGDQTVSEQSTVTLSGSGTDSDGTIASYSWTQTSGVSVTLNNATSQAPSFVAPETLDPVTLQFELTVTDNEGATAKDQVAVAVQPLNAAPTANAGGDQTVSEQSTVTLSGSGTDSDGTIASYSWTQTSGASVTLNNATSQAPSFVAPETLDPITLQFELTVTDNEGATAKDQVAVAVIRVVPTLSSTSLMVDETAFENDRIGQVNVVREGKSEITDFNLSGTGSNYFNINSDGIIFIAPGTILDHASTPAYTLSVVAANSYGQSNDSTVLIEINEVNKFIVSSSGELQQALNTAAVNGLDDHIILQDGVYSTNLNNNSTFTYFSNENYNLTITGYGEEKTIVSGDSTNRVFKFTGIEPFGTIALRKLSVSNGFVFGDSGGAGIYTELDLEVNRLSFSNNVADREDSVNAPGGSGSAILVRSAKGVIENSVIMDNGNLSNARSSVAGDLDISSSGFYGNNGAISLGTCGGNSGCILDNLTISNNSGFAISVCGADWTLSNSVISNNTANSGFGSVLYDICGGGTVKNAHIDNVKVTDNTSAQYTFRSTVGMTITNSIFANNTVTTGSNRGLLEFEFKEKTKIVNSLFYGSMTDALLEKNSKVINSMFLGLNEIRANDNIISNSLIDPSKIIGTYISVNNIYGDPMFVDSTSNNFHLLDGSIAIDTGVNTYEGLEVPTSDLDGHTRPNGLSTDIGPYEHP